MSARSLLAHGCRARGASRAWQPNAGARVTRPLSFTASRRADEHTEAQPEAEAEAQGDAQAESRGDAKPKPPPKMRKYGVSQEWLDIRRKDTALRSAIERANRRTDPEKLKLFQDKKAKLDKLAAIQARHDTQVQNLEKVRRLLEKERAKIDWDSHAEGLQNTHKPIEDENPDKPNKQQKKPHATGSRSIFKSTKDEKPDKPDKPDKQQKMEKYLERRVSHLEGMLQRLSHNQEPASDSTPQFPRVRTLKETAWTSSNRQLLRRLSHVEQKIVHQPSPKTFNPYLPDNLRTILRHVHHPVMIATTARRLTDHITDPNEDRNAATINHAPVVRGRTGVHHGFAGLTVSSFACVSLADGLNPAVSFNIKLPSRTFDMLAQFGQSGVNGAPRPRVYLHILSGDAAGAAAAEAFRTPSATDEEVRAKLKKAGLELVRRELNTDRDWREEELVRVGKFVAAKDPSEAEKPSAVEMKQPVVSAEEGMEGAVKEGEETIAPLSETITEKKKVEEGEETTASLSGTVTEKKKPHGRLLHLHPPHLKGPGVVCVLRCSLMKGRGLTLVRDHALVLADVTSVIDGHGAQMVIEPLPEEIAEEKKKKRAVDKNGEPVNRHRVVIEEDKVGLGYLGRKYRGVGPVLDVERGRVYRVYRVLRWMMFR